MNVPPANKLPPPWIAAVEARVRSWVARAPRPLLTASLMTMSLPTSACVGEIDSARHG